MTAVQWICGPIAAALIIVGFALLGRASVQIYRTVRLGGPDPTRHGSPMARATTLVKEFLGHTRMLKWGIVGVAHWFVMVGFGALVLTLVEAVGETFYPQFEIPWLGQQAWYGLFVELIALTTVLGIGTLIVIRQLAHPRRANRRSRFAGSNFPQAYFVETVILTIGICIFLIRGFKSATGNLPYPTWAAPISTGLGKILPASLAAISIVALVKVDHLDGLGHRDLPEPDDGGGLAPVPGVLQHLLQARGVRPDRAGCAAADDVRRGAAGFREGRPGGRHVRRREDRGLLLEGLAGLLHLHRVRPVPVAVPGVEHREAVVAEAGDARAARPRVRQGAVPRGGRRHRHGRRRKAE